MSQGQLWLFNKIKQSGFYTRSVVLDIVNTFNMEENLNDTPSNMKVKVVTSNTYREEFEVNTIAYHPDTTTWWVIKSDTSAYLHTGEYEHEIELVELLEFYSYRHLPNCAFASNTYTLDQMITRVFAIGKQTDIAVVSPYPSFLDSAKQMPFLSFENFTIANAIKTIARSINAIPKVFATLVIGEVIYIENFKLTFINRNGNEETIVDNLNAQFPIAYEHNSNSNDQFLTRSVSNISNAKSSTLVISPQQGGFKNISPNSLEYDEPTAIVTLPSKIDKIDFVRVYVPLVVRLGSSVLYSGYYFTKQPIIDAINASTLPGATPSIKATMISNLPDPIVYQQVNYKDVIDKDYNPATSDNTRANLFFKKMSLLNKFEFDTASKIVGGFNVVDQDVKDRTIHWTPNSNIMIMPISFRNGLAGLIDHNPTYNLYSEGGSVVGFLQTRRRSSGFFNLEVPNDEVLIQVGYYPIADIKVSYDNDNEAQDEKFFNQSGKVVDTFSTSQLIISHTNDSVEGTKIRNARYDKNPYKLFTGIVAFSISPPSSPVNGQYWFKTDTSVLQERVSGAWVVVPFTSGTTTPANTNELGLRFVNTATSQLFISQTVFSSLIPLGQIIRDSNELYVVSQRSIDMMFRDNGNNYFNVIYTLSKNRVARSENIQADSAVINYKTPDDNLVKRSQLYKDYIELSLRNGNKDSRYLPMAKVLVLTPELSGTEFDFTVLAKNTYDSTTIRYVQNPTIFELAKAKLFNVNWQDNNVLGFRLDSTGDNYVQTPIVYTNDIGKATNFELLVCNSKDILDSQTFYNSNYTPNDIIPFNDLTNVNDNFYTDSVFDENHFSIQIAEPNYDKDPFEIPVFEYMIQGNDNYDVRGNVVIGNELFTTFKNVNRFHYVISDTRFTAENETRLWSISIPGITTRTVTITRPTSTQFNLSLFSSSSVANSVSLLNKHIGFYAVKSDGSRKFLFAINDYNMESNNLIDLYINNWKI